MKSLKGISLATTMLICFVGLGQEKSINSQQSKTNSLQGLSGKIDGINIIKPNCNSGCTKITLNCRPTNYNNALWIVNGIEYDSINKSPINPDDIESINVIKAINAISLYGVKGKKGVIVIKTKK